ncbi:hypothetical protein EsDP_00006850 [Epichloe bromicola]|uniref:Uncharacterized protein n=1 Tax=Epichloe bromicola TaxID=79588 RepID=A0ABQ0CYT9_9HYPO
MRLNTTLFTVGVLLGTALADIKTIKASMKDVKYTVNNLTEAIKSWDGNPSTAGEMLCKMVDVRKSMDACVEAFEKTPKRMTNEEFPGLLRLGLFSATRNLEKQAIKKKTKFDNIGVTVPLFEVIKAQKEPTSDMFKATKAIADKLPPDFKSRYMFYSKKTPLEFLQSFMNGTIDDLLEAFKPQGGLSPLSFVTPFVPMAVRASKFFNTDPLCRSIPSLMKTLAGQSINLRDFTDQTLKFVDFSRVQNVVIPLDSINNVAKAFGMPPSFFPNVVKRIGISEQRLSLSEITKKVPNLLSTKVSTLTTQALRVLKSSDVQNVARLDVIKVAEFIGVSRDTTNKALQRIGIFEQRLSVSDFTNKVPGLLNKLKVGNKALGKMDLGDIVLDTPTMIRFADSIVKELLGSAPR